MNTAIAKYIDSASRMLDPRSRDLEPAAGDYSNSWLRVRNIDDDKRQVTALVSTPNPDRYEEIVEPSAFAKWLPTFMDNPVFLSGHRHGSPDGQPTVLGQWVKMEVTKEGLFGTAQFDDEDELAKRFWNHYRKKNMRGFSVGWLTHEWEMREFDLGNGIKRRIRVFTEVELLEVSAVAVPANRQSVARAASFAGATAGDSDNTTSDELRQLVTDTIRKELRIEPGSTNEAFVRDIGEAILRGQGNDPLDDVQTPGLPEGTDRFIEQMRDLR